MSFNSTYLAVFMLQSSLANSHVEFPWWDTIWSMVNLTVIIVGIWVFFGKKIKTLFADRHDNIVQEIKSSQDALDQAQKDHSAAKEKESSLEETISGYQDQINQEIEFIRQNEAQQAADLRASYKNDLNNQITMERSQMTKRIMGTVVNDVIEQTNANLAEQSSMDVHSKIVDRLLDSLAGSTGDELVKTIKGDY